MSDWTEETLVRLRAGRFTPRAWIGFLAASFARARELRSSYPTAHRTVLSLAAAGAVACLAAGLAGHARLAVACAVWWLGACAMVDWHLGMLDGRDRLGVANIVTLFRAGTVPALLLLRSAPAELALFALAGASDVLDGMLARSRGEATRLGLWLDGSADGLVVGAAAVVALPAWAAIVVICRNALPWLAIAGSYFLRARRPHLEARVSGRLPGLLVFAGITLSFLSLPGAPLIAVAGALVGLAKVAAIAVRAQAYAA